MRLDKYLAEMGAGTRSELKKAVRAGRVTINGVKAKDSSIHVGEDDVVCMDGKEIKYERLDLIGGQQRRGLFPVGRLDKDTEGLLLITNDGELAHRLLSPGRHVDKVYFARLDGPVGERERELFAQGLRVDETLTAMPAVLEILEPANEVRVTIREGKFHQVKRMFAAVGREVLYLKRLSMGPLTLDNGLAAGAYRRLTEEEESAIISV